MSAWIAGAVGVQALSGLAQYYQNQKAMKASEKRLREIEEAFNNIAPPNFDMSIMDAPELIMERVDAPEFDMSNLRPQDYKVLKEFSPEIAEYVKQEAPQVVRDTAEGKEGRDAQLSALRKLKSTGESGFDPMLQNRLDEASRESQIASQSRQESVLQDAQRRGQMGSGTMLAAQLQGGSDAMLGAAEQSRGEADSAYRNQLQALRDSANLGGDVRREELGLQETNADIINKFNQMASTNYQNYLNKQAQARNEGNIFNIEQGQNIANKNVSQNNEAVMADRARRDALQKYSSEFRQGERGNINNMIMNKYNVKRSERDNQNELQQKMFNNRMDKQKGASGIAGDRIDLGTQQSKNQNQMYQSMGDVTSTGLQTYGQQQQGTQSDRRAFARDVYGKTGKMPTEKEMDDYEQY